MKNIKIIIISSFCLLIIIFLGLYIENKQSENTTIMRKVKLLEMEITGKTNNLAKSSQVVQIESGQFSFFQSFKLDINLEKRLQVGEQDYYRYYINQQNKSTLEGDYEVETLNNGGFIKFIALQGDKAAKVRVVGDEQWSEVLEVPFAANSTSKIRIEINWDTKGSNELTIFPIRNDKSDFYSGSNLGIVRAAVLNANLDINNFNEINTRKQNEPPSGLPTPALINQQMENVKLIKNDAGTKVSGKYSAIQLKSVNYNATVDTILVDEDGNTETLQSDIPIIKNQSTIIELPENLLNQVQAETKRYFVLFLNNRGDQQIKDIVSIINKQQQFPTTFNLVIELFKYKEE